MDVNEAEAKHRTYLWSLNGVVAVGIGYGEFFERPTIDVYVRRRLPEHNAVVKSLEGYEVRVRDVMELRAPALDEATGANQPQPSSAALEQLTPPLLKWVEAGSQLELRRIVIIPRAFASIDQAIEALKANGVKVEGSGGGVITAAVTPATLMAIVDLPWIVAVREARIPDRPSRDR
jgi:hypothetical protein